MKDGTCRPRSRPGCFDEDAERNSPAERWKMGTIVVDLGGGGEPGIMAWRRVGVIFWDLAHDALEGRTLREREPYCSRGRTRLAIPARTIWIMDFLDKLPYPVGQPIKGITLPIYRSLTLQPKSIAVSAVQILLSSRLCCFPVRQSK